MLKPTSRRRGVIRGSNLEVEGLCNVEIIGYNVTARNCENIRILGANAHAIQCTSVTVVGDNPAFTACKRVRLTTRSEDVEIQVVLRKKRKKTE